MRYKIEDILVLSSEPFDRNYDLEASQRKFDEYVDTLTAKHQEEIEKAVEAEREYTIGIIKKYEAMPFSPTTFSRIKASILPTKTDKQKDV